MPRNVDSASISLEEKRLREINREIEKKREFDKIEKREIAKSKKSRLSNTPINRKPVDGEAKYLRRNTRQSMRFDKELSMNPYVVSESGRYWYENVEMTLAVITHARMIMASNTKRIHDYGDDNERRIK